MKRQVLVVGAGLFGCVMAERIAGKLGCPVTVIDKRGHIGGNCYSEVDPLTGIEIHKYGPHIFHTSHSEVWEYVSQFTEWNNYRHHVWTRHRGKTYPMPINLATINSFYGRSFTPCEAKNFIAEEIAKEGIEYPSNLEEKAISLIGRPLYEAFIRGYTVKQWEKDPRDLSPEIITRLPVRLDYNSRYFNDRWEGIPVNGYTAIFENMLANPLIKIRLSTDWFDMRDSLEADTLVIYSGPIDGFYDYKFGRLEWRTLDFETIYYPVSNYQGIAQLNEADAEVPQTRFIEYRHFQTHLPDPGETVVIGEISRFSSADDEPFYPVNTKRNRDLLAKYTALAEKETNVIFGGRLGHYKYYDMDMTIGMSLETFKRYFVN